MNPMSQKSRIGGITEAPISYKERDLITAAEKFMTGAIDFPIVEYVSVCFPKVESKLSQKIDRVWTCTTAAYHLEQQIKQDDLSQASKKITNNIQLKAARIYEHEAQRILGSVFPMEHPFWKAFYLRQQEELTKPLIAIDAFYFLTQQQKEIDYQLLTQSFKSLLKGYYLNYPNKKNQFENAKRLLVDLNLEKLQAWLNQQMV